MNKSFISLDKYLQKIGNIFFRWRSYIPLLLIPILFLKTKNLQIIFNNHYTEMAYQLICVIISITGEFVRIITIGYVPSGTSGRNTKEQRATTLNTSGTYSIMRNPLYFGNYLIILGISLFWRSWELVIFNSLLFAFFYVPIILVEERFLLNRFNDDYREYIAKSPCFFPRFSLWNPANTKWSWKMVIRREYNSVFALSLSFALVAHIRLYLINNKMVFGISWLIFVGVFMALWLVIRFLKIAKRL